MRHLRWIPPGEWPQEQDPETGELRDVPVRGGMVRGMVLLGEHPDGGWLVDAVGGDPAALDDGLPGHRIAEGHGRYDQLPPREKTVAWRQAVWRADGLRSSVLSDLGRSEPGGAPLSPVGRGELRGAEHREADDDAMLDRVRELAADESTPGPARLRVPLREVGPEDVVEGEPEPGARWAGE